MEAERSAEGLQSCACAAHSDARGHHVVAAENLSAGVTVCRAPLTAIAISEAWKRNVCAFCLSVSATDAELPFSCTACEQAFYCTEECGRRHLRSDGLGSVAHRHVCPALQRFGALEEFGAERSKPRLMLELLARRALGATAGTAIDALQHHAPPWADDATEDGDAARGAWARCCEAFRGTVKVCGWCEWRAGGGSRVAPPSDAELYALLSRVDVNCFGAAPERRLRPGGGGEHRGRGVEPNTGSRAGEEAPEAVAEAEGGAALAAETVADAIYLGACGFNHCCAPSCGVSRGLGCSVLRVHTEVKVDAGDELTISYVDVGLPVRARRRALLEQYGFECDCRRCVEEIARDLRLRSWLRRAALLGSLALPVLVAYAVLPVNE